VCRRRERGSRWPAGSAGAHCVHRRPCYAQGVLEFSALHVEFLRARPAPDHATRKLAPAMWQAEQIRTRLATLYPGSAIGAGRPCARRPRVGEDRERVG
jgi:hypothetical protein